MSRYDDFSLQQANQFRVTTDGSITIAEAPSQDLPTKCVVLNPINNSTVAPVTIFYQPTNDNKIIVLKRLEEQQECSEDDIINEIKKSLYYLWVLSNILALSLMCTVSKTVRLRL